MSSGPAAAAAATAAGAGVGGSDITPAAAAPTPFYLIVRVIVKGDAEDDGSIRRFDKCPNKESLIGSAIHRELAGRKCLRATHLCNSLPPAASTLCEAKSTGYEFDPDLDCECQNPDLKFDVTFDRFDSKEARDTSYRGQIAVRKFYQSYTYVPDDGYSADLYFYTYDFEPRSVVVAAAVNDYKQNGGAGSSGK